MIRYCVSWGSGLLLIVLLSATGCGARLTLGELQAPATHLVAQQDMMLGDEACSD